VTHRCGWLLLRQRCKEDFEFRESDGKCVKYPPAHRPTYPPVAVTLTPSPTPCRSAVSSACLQVCPPGYTRRYFKNTYLVGCLAPGSCPGSYKDGYGEYPFYRRRQRRDQEYSHPEIDPLGT
jgi:hypothetical protein